MIPKVETCIEAIEAGVQGVVILNGKTPHSVLLELFTEQDGQVVRERLVAGALELDPRGRALVLAGSVGQPRDHLGRQAKYLLWNPEADRIEVRAVDYDVQATVRLLHERGFPAVNARRLGG